MEGKSADVTVVTAYYAIPSKFTHEKYMEWAANFLRNIACKLVIFTDAKNLETLTSMRDWASDRTRVVCKEFEQLYFYRHIDFFRRQYQTDDEKYSSPEF
ncbi:MAG: hypothetical protein ACYCOU_07290 [Sulfobacillus sp.]